MVFSVMFSYSITIQRKCKVNCIEARKHGHVVKEKTTYYFS